MTTYTKPKERASDLCDLIHLACDLVSVETTLDEQSRAEIELGLRLALVAALRWREDSTELELPNKS